MPFDNLGTEQDYIQTPALPDDAEWRKTLIRAAEIVRERGWTTGGTTARPANDRGVCIMEAIGLAAGFPYSGGVIDYCRVEGHPATSFAAKAAGSGRSAHLYEWNDKQCDGGEQCIAVLEAAAREPGR